MTDEFREAFLAEVFDSKLVTDFFAVPEGERPGTVLFSRPWDEKGPCADALFDATLVRSLLEMAVGPRYHFCHSAIALSLRGTGALAFHQDNEPLDPGDADKPYVQILYYPNGFRRVDTSLSVIAGSHKVVPVRPAEGEPITAALLNERYGDQLEQPFREEQLELPPGSFVFLNARMYHAVAPKPEDSPQECRVYANYIYKDPTSRHHWTQPIPPAWLETDDPHRLALFDRPAYDGPPVV
jgi:hypothetical protein